MSGKESMKGESPEFQIAKDLAERYKSYPHSYSAYLEGFNCGYAEAKSQDEPMRQLLLKFSDLETMQELTMDDVRQFSKELLNSSK